MSEEFFGEKAAARVLNIHFDTLRRWRKQGRIAHYKSATGRISYRFEDLMGFALAERVDPAPNCPAGDSPDAAAADLPVIYPFNRPAIRR